MRCWDKFLEHFDGFSSAPNDMTQLTLGLDRDSGFIAHLFDRAQRGGQGTAGHGYRRRPQGRQYVGSAQWPSDHPDFAAWLVEQGSIPCRSTLIRGRHLAHSGHKAA